MDRTRPAATRHTPVLVDRCVALLAPAVESGGTVVDCTLGMGGHSEAILTALPSASVVGIDRDPQAIALASARLAPFGDRFTAVTATYDQIDRATSGQLVQGVLMDLGVSSLQLDEEDRGFSYAADAPLDMRMDQSSGRTAADILAEDSEAEIRQILYRFGEEKFAPRIAKEIIRRRATAPNTRTGEFADLVRASIPAAARRTGGNPAKRSFQALRIAVNEELAILADAVPAAMDALDIGGRIVVMAYQSLEDRIVKREFVARSTSSAPPDLPVELPEHRPTFRLLTRGAEQADEAEIAANPRSSPVRLRAAERIARSHR